MLSFSYIFISESSVLFRTETANHSSLRLTLSVIKTEKEDVKVNSDISDGKIMF